MAHSKRGSLRVIDVCAGTGVLGRSLLERGGARISFVSFVEQNPSLADECCATAEPWGPHVSTITADLFSGGVDEPVGRADVILCNPPFMSYHKWRGQTGGRKVHESGLRPHPDISCYFVLRLVELSTRGAIIGLIVRNALLESAGYSRFRNDLLAHCEVLNVIDLGRNLRPGSGAAESSILVLRRSEATGTRSASLVPVERAAQIPSGWCRISDIATVKAGPSVRSDRLQLPDHNRYPSVVRVPPQHDGSLLWGENFTRRIAWEPPMFSAARNLSFQGRPGFVYSLAGSQFRTVVLPSSVYFLSGSPAVQPISLFDLDFLTGCALLPRWRRLVRSQIKSRNFTPSAVGSMPVPHGLPLRSEIEMLGKAARERVNASMTSGGECTFSLREMRLLARADEQLAYALDRFSELSPDPNSKCWP